MSKKTYNSGGAYKSSSWFDFDSWKGSKYSYKPKKRAEIVKPYMSWWDHSKLNRSIRDENKEFFNTMHIPDKSNLKGIDTTDKVNAARVLYKQTITEDLIHDIYSIYYNPSDKLVFDKQNDSNKVKFKILEKVNNSLLKIVSNNNSIASFMYTKEICNFLFAEIWNQLSEQEKKDLADAMKDMNSEEESEDDDSDNESEDGKSKDGKSKSKNKNKNKSNDGDNDEDGDNDGNGDGEDDHNTSENPGEQGEDSEPGDGSDSKNGEKSSNTGSNQSSGAKGDGNTKGDNSKFKSKDTSGHNVKENVDKEKIDNWRKEHEKQEEERRKKEKTKNDKLSDTIENIFNKTDVQKRFNEAIGKADQIMQDMEKAGIQLDNKNIDDLSAILNINNIRHEIAQLAINKGAIAEAIKNILDKSINYFSKKYQIKEIDFFEADEIFEIFGVEYIHPVFRSGMLDRLTTEERKPLGRIDLYIDVSGSMSSGSGIPGVSNLMFAKSIALAMLNMDMLNRLYVFDTSVREVPATEMGILSIGCGGGTEIDCVTRHVINKARNNGICLTDGECSVSIYDERMFMLGTMGVFFNYFYSTSEGKNFLKAGQCINFDGKTVNKIQYDENSKAAKGNYW